MKARILIVFLFLAVSAYGVDRHIDGVALTLKRSESGDYAFVIRNDSRGAVWYTGYTEEKGAPAFNVEVLRSGKWVEVPLGWCGVGMCDSRL